MATSTVPEAPLHSGDSGISPPLLRPQRHLRASPWRTPLPWQSATTQTAGGFGSHPARDAAARVAHAYTNPSLEVYEGEQYARPVATPGIPGLLQHYAAYQTIEIPSERRARQRAAQSAVASSRSAEQAVMFSVVADTKHAFYNALRRREEIDHAQENLQLVQDLRRRVEVSVNVGEEGPAGVDPGRG